MFQTGYSSKIFSAHVKYFSEWKIIFRCGVVVNTVRKPHSSTESNPTRSVKEVCDDENIRIKFWLKIRDEMSLLLINYSAKWHANDMELNPDCIFPYEVKAKKIEERDHNCVL